MSKLLLFFVAYLLELTVDLDKENIIYHVELGALIDRAT